MPPDDPSTAEWSLSDQIPKLPRQSLAREEVEAFLQLMFTDVAVKPNPMTIAEGARVVRYLLAAAQTVAGPERATIVRLADSVGRTLFHAAPIKMAPKDDAVLFLERYAATYPLHPELQPVIELVGRLEEPPAGKDYFPQPALASKIRAVFGPGTPRLPNDLSERIYASYHALKRTGRHAARGLVAKALNQSGIQTGSLGSNREWGSAEVWERVKQYETRLKRDHRVTGDALRSLRDGIVDQWIHFARFQTWEPKPKA